MLIELYGVLLTLIPVISFCFLFSEIANEKYRNEIKLSSTIRESFFDGKCDGSECDDSKIKVKGLKAIKIRKPAKPFTAKNKEGKNETLDSLYGELEKAAKDSPHK